MFRFRYTVCIVLCCVLLFSTASIAQVGDVDREASQKPEIMILGTYHMAKTTSNVFNKEVDNILTAERQRQLAELIRKLKQFEPTKIVTEIDISNSAEAQERYERYLAGEYELTENEVDQIGFRLAKELGHERIYSADWGIIPEDPIFNYITYVEDHPELQAYLDDLNAKMGKHYTEEFSKLREMTVIEQMIYLNSQERMDTDHQAYFEIMRIGKGDEYSGADYLSWWYGRNMKILVNIIRITEPPEDRILVIYGAGHAKLLNQLARESGFYHVVDAHEFLTK